MKSASFEALLGEISAIRPARWVGRIVAVGDGRIEVSGLSNKAALGDMVLVERCDGSRCPGEVLKLGMETVTVLPDDERERFQIGAPVLLEGPATIAPHESWLGHLIDPYGNPLDGGAVLRGQEERPLRASPPDAATRRGLGPRLETGLALFNTILPIARGQRVGVFAGSGVGKTTLLGRLALGLDADVVVVAMIGERGREVRDFVERILGPDGMRRAVVLAATSDRSPIARRRCGLAAMATAEYFRDQGRHVLLIADSITRFAEAHRAAALSSGETAHTRGLPPSTGGLISSLCERAGPGCHGQGDITAIFNVLVAGSDMDEPVADMLRGVLDGHVVLDRAIAERGRFPAVDVLRSVSRALPDAATQEENELIQLTRQRLGEYDRNELMVRSGLYVKGTDQQIDAAVECFPRLDAFFSQDGDGGISGSFSRLAAILRESGHDPEINGRESR